MKNFAGITAAILLVFVLGYSLWPATTSSVVTLDAITPTSKDTVGALMADHVSANKQPQPAAKHVVSAQPEALSVSAESKLLKLTGQCDETDMLTLSNLIDNAMLFLKQSSIRDNLQQTDDGISQLTYLFDANDYDTAALTPQLLALSQQYPNDPIVAYDAMVGCSSTSLRCSDDDIAELLQGNTSNAAFWMLQANRLLQQQQESEALQALQQVIDAPVFQTFWGEHIVAFKQAYLQAGAADSLPVMLQAVTLSARTGVPNYAPLSRYCGNLAPEQTQALAVCLQVGQRMASSQTTYLVNMIGFSLQTKVLQKLDDAPALAAVAAQKAQFTKVQQQMSQLQGVLMFDRNLTADWLDNLRNAGEAEGTMRSVHQLLKVASAPDFNPCTINW